MARHLSSRADPSSSPSGLRRFLCLPVARRQSGPGSKSDIPLRLAPSLKGIEPTKLPDASIDPPEGRRRLPTLGVGPLTATAPVRRSPDAPTVPFQGSQGTRRPPDGARRTRRLRTSPRRPSLPSRHSKFSPAPTWGREGSGEEGRERWTRRKEEEEGLISLLPASKCGPTVHPTVSARSDGQSDAASTCAGVNIVEPDASNTPDGASPLRYRDPTVTRRFPRGFPCDPTHPTVRRCCFLL